MDPWRVSLPVCVVGPSNGRREPRSRAEGVWGYAVADPAGPRGSRRRFAPPHHEGLASCRLFGPHPEERLKAASRRMGRAKSAAMHPHPRGMNRPSLASNQNPRKRGRRESRVLRSHPQPRVRDRKRRKHTSEYRYAETFRPSLRNGVTAYSALSPVSGLTATVARRPVPCELDPSIGGPGPHAFAVRQPHPSSDDAVRVHRSPRSTSVTTRTPLQSRRDKAHTIT